jgi:hypothetical protein
VYGDQVVRTPDRRRHLDRHHRRDAYVRCRDWIVLVSVLAHLRATIIFVVPSFRSRKPSAAAADHHHDQQHRRWKTARRAPTGADRE